MAQGVKTVETRYVLWEAKHFLLRKSKTFTVAVLIQQLSLWRLLSFPVSLFDSGNNDCCVCKVYVTTGQMPPQHLISSRVSVPALLAFISAKGFLSLALLDT